MGRLYLPRPHCLDCGERLKSLYSRRCRSCSQLGKNRERNKLSLETRLIEKVSIPDDPDNCWLWTGAIDPQTGYGRIGLGGRGQGIGNAHRVMYEIVYEFIGDGAEICHTCDNRACVNPHHLYEGDKSSNMVDSWLRGGHRKNYERKYGKTPNSQVRQAYENDKQLKARVK